MYNDNKTQYKGYTIAIEPDNEPESPRQWDNLGIMVCYHSRYNLGDEITLPFSVNELGGWDEVYTELDKMGAIAITPIYMYDHSGITIKTSPFGDRWDSGQVGYIYTTKERVKEFSGLKTLTKKAIEIARRQLVAEVATYDQYLTGDVWGYIITESEHCDKCGHTEEVEQDSCWGFYGQEEALKEAKSVVDGFEKEVSK